MTADPGLPGSAINGHGVLKLEGLAVAIPWGFESPLPHHSFGIRLTRDAERELRCSAGALRAWPSDTSPPFRTTQ